MALQLDDTGKKTQWNRIRIPGRGTYLVGQWVRICLPMQRMWVQSLVRELRSHMLGHS